MTKEAGNLTLRKHLLADRVRSGWAGLCAVGLCLVLAGIAFAADPSLVHTYQLMSEMEAHVLNDASLHLRWIDEDVVRSPLRLFVPLEASRRLLDPQEEVFTGLFAEGTPGGQRGFARGADDDADGFLDEDPADGRDNDADGLIDEDFAAISDAMLVVDRPHGRGHLHLETYHWGYAHLRSTVALEVQVLDTSGEGHPADLAVEIASGGWQRVDGLPPFSHQLLNPLPENSKPAASAGGARLRPAFLTVLAHPQQSGTQLWLGVARLGPPSGPDDLHRHRVRLNGRRLEFPILDGGSQLAVSVAVNPQQVLANLASASEVCMGAANLDGSRQVGWIVPPHSLAYRVATDPTARAVKVSADRWQLVFRVSPGDHATFDPDRFALDGQPLGPPVSLRWHRREEGPGEEEGLRDWGSRRLADLGKLDLASLDPYHSWDDLKHQNGQGELIFEFGSTPPETSTTHRAVLTGHSMRGRYFRAELAPWPPRLPGEAAHRGPPSTEHDLQIQFRESGQPPALNPDLLESFPNPFRDEARIRYQVPATIEEGFQWEVGKAPEVDPQDPIPYQSSPPSVSLKVYSLSGQELATLFEGSLSPGGYVAHWNGTDMSGRTVASGTYFCKLQIDSWFLTKRLIFVR